MAAVAALCVQYEADFRPNMSIVVKALQPLLNPRSGPPSGTPQRLWILSDNLIFLAGYIIEICFVNRVF